MTRQRADRTAGCNGISPSAGAIGERRRRHYQVTGAVEQSTTHSFSPVPYQLHRAQGLDGDEETAGDKERRVDGVLCQSEAEAQ